MWAFQRSRAILIGLAVLTIHQGAAQPLPVEELKSVKDQVARQQVEIDALKAALAEQRALLEKLTGTRGEPTAQHVRSQELVAAPNPAPEQAPAATLPGGFELSGDFRYRYDLALRSGNEVAPALQNSRARYRFRLNIDKALDRNSDPKLKLHAQLSTGLLNVETTNDQDFGAMGVKHPFFLSEAYVDYRPFKAVSLRGGRMEEVFADNSRFLWDDDMRFNGFHQIIGVPMKSRPFGIREVEFRAGEYILSNPNIAHLSPESVFVTASETAGAHVRSSALFHPGAIVRGDLTSRWTHQVQADMMLYRRPNQIQLASTAGGYNPVVGNTIGIQLAAPVGALGNATTRPGGAIYSASRWEIAHVGYRLERKGVQLGGREMPLWFDFQASRNVGASKLRDALMASVNLGSVRERGDIRVLYQFAIKDANALISQFTDDDLGTQVTTNIAVHAVRFDLGLTRYLQVQNLLFLQNQRRPNAPDQQFYVPLQRGANTTVRFLGQLAFTF